MAGCGGVAAVRILSLLFEGSLSAGVLSSALGRVTEGVIMAEVDCGAAVTPLSPLIATSGPGNT